jgi:hypothetical protein
MSTAVDILMDNVVQFCHAHDDGYVVTMSTLCEPGAAALGAFDTDAMVWDEQFGPSAPGAARGLQLGRAHPGMAAPRRAGALGLTQRAPTDAAVPAPGSLGIASTCQRL